VADPDYNLWYAVRRRLPVILGAASCGLAGYALMRAGVVTPVGATLASFVGALIGHLVEGYKTEAAARRELLEMRERQKEWTRAVEDEVTARTAALERLEGALKDLHEARATTLLGFSHDLRNPLHIIRISVEYLMSAPAIDEDPDATEAVRDLAVSVDRMQTMLGDLVEVTKAQRDFVTMASRTVETEELVVSLRRRLRALVSGTEVRAAVFATRDAPPRLTIDPVALDRIVDNLLTNAAKYTERGSIIVELDGLYGFLVIKVSDTGRGVQPDAIEQIFEAGGSAVESRRGDSHGVGLSVVAQLLDQMGGRIEVMSRPGDGTTFWVYVPVRAPTNRTAPVSPRPTESGRAPSRRVVLIRKQSA
jgi:signal transduction histidine kinase